MFFPFYFVLCHNNVVIVSGGQRRDSAMHIHVSFLPQTDLDFKSEFFLKETL